MDKTPPPLTPLFVSLAAAANASEPDATLLREPTRRGPPPTPRDRLRLDEASAALAAARAANAVADAANAAYYAVYAVYAAARRAHLADLANLIRAAVPVVPLPGGDR